MDSLRPSRSVDRDLPLGICFHINEDDDLYGDRICNSGMAISIISILVAMALLMMDIQAPCTGVFVCDTNIVTVYS